jgi:hypothetical protein
MIAGTLLHRQRPLKLPMKRSFVHTVLLSFWVFSASLCGDPSKVITTIQEKTSWRPASKGESPDTFDSDTLSRHRPEHAKVFLEYGFSKLTTWRLADTQGRLVVLDLYEMIDPPAAYGIFTFLRKPTAEPVGDLGNMAAESLMELSFQQNRYYVSLKAGDSIKPLRESLRGLARIVSQSLPSTFAMPPVADRLPQEGRVPYSEKFFMGSAALGNFLPMQGDDPFGIETGAEAALARYQSAGAAATLLLIHYPTQQLAKKFLDAGYAQYSAQYPGQPVFYKREGPMVVMVLASNSPELATALLDRVSYVSIVSWDPKVEPPSIGQVMLNIFIYCGIMLAITFAAGFVFGIIRILIKWLFPGKVFDRPKDMEVIRLKLDHKE